jgi:4-amino-4-deoxy-L-arabinose transferase-like glycosyltransferase
MPPSELRSEPTCRGHLLVAVPTLCLFVALLLALAWRTPWTTDEPTYLQAGRLLRERLEFDSVITYLHGPLPFYATQIGAWLGASTEPLLAHRFPGRLGMLVFALFGALALWSLARRMFGPTVGVLALALYCLNPFVLAHGCLMTTDTSLVGFYVLALLLVWRWTERPSSGLALGLGVVVGLGLATKYLAVFLLPTLAACLAWAVLRGVRPGSWLSAADGAAWRRWADAAGAAMLCGGAALLALWAAYGFAPPGYDTGVRLTMSRLLARLVELPLVPTLLRALPDPWVRGIDYMTFFSESGGSSYVLGHIAPGHWYYYLVALGVKMPLVLLLLLPFGVLGRWPARAALPVALGILVPLCWLSLFQALQLGLRHMLQVIPLLCLLAARPLAFLWRRGRIGRALVFGAFAWLAVCHAITWPRYLSAFNSLVGDRPYEWFRDSNFAWHSFEVPDDDRLELERRHPDAQRVFAQSGPRLGKVLVFAPDLCLAADADGFANHWLRSFRPIECRGAWCVFRSDEGAFDALVRAATPARAVEARVRFAIALATSGLGARALEAVAGIDEPRAASVRALVELERSGGDGSTEHARLLFALGRFDRVADMPAAPTGLRASALFTVGRIVAARDLVLAEAERRELSLEERLQLAFLHMHNGDHALAMAVLDALQVGPTDAAWGVVQTLRWEVQRHHDYVAPVARRIGR